MSIGYIDPLTMIPPQALAAVEELEGLAGLGAAEEVLGNVSEEALYGLGEVAAYGGYRNALAAVGDEMELRGLGSLGKKKKKKGFGKFFKGLAKTVVPMVSNYFVPGSGGAVSSMFGGKKKGGGGGEAAPVQMVAMPAGPAAAAGGGGLSLNSPVVLIGGAALLAVVLMRK
ncbi:MAG: hypothetical protein ACKVW3_11755 [Phycisphaerales bacterium]